MYLEHLQPQDTGSTELFNDECTQIQIILTWIIVSPACLSSFLISVSKNTLSLQVTGI